MNGWIFSEYIDCTLLNIKDSVVERIGNAFLLHMKKVKFQNDSITNLDGKFLEGYITNKSELLNQFKYQQWSDLYSRIVLEEEFPTMLRGGFCGITLEGKRKEFFSDHIGSKALFYFYQNSQLIVSTNLLWIAQLLKKSNMSYSLDEQAIKCMLTYGFMIDDTTFIKEVKRVMPGQKVIVDGNNITIQQYYAPQINQIENISEEEAIEMIDKAFRQAVQREFEKDVEYGYSHLVDLSGGLDSRMVSWVAHELGYTNQTNWSYCKSEYLDYKIASHIAKDLKHEFYFKQLDDCQWLYDIDDILQKSNGEAMYSGITGGKAFLENLSKEKYGIEHTGMLGDVIVSSFAVSKDAAYGRPKFGRNQYSNMLQYDFSNIDFCIYGNQEICDLYTRGFLGAMSSYAIRQQYFEVSSPFLDVDFMNTCFCIPMEFRCKHNIYLKWIKECYPNALNYGWEKWAGVLPKRKLALWRDIVFAYRKIKRLCRRAVGLKINDNMNPIEYWYSSEKSIQDYFDLYYSTNVNNSYINNEIRKDIHKMFTEGSANEKTQVLTVLGMLKLLFSEE